MLLLIYSSILQNRGCGIDGRFPPGHRFRQFVCLHVSLSTVVSSMQVCFAFHFLFTFCWLKVVSVFLLLITPTSTLSFFPHALFYEKYICKSVPSLTVVLVLLIQIRQTPRRNKKKRRAFDPIRLQMVVVNIQYSYCSAENMIDLKSGNIRSSSNSLLAASYFFVARKRKLFCCYKIMLLLNTPPYSDLL